MAASNLLVLAGFLVSVLAIVGSRAASVIDLKDPAQVERLRQMFEKDHNQAINDFYEQKALKAITTNSSQAQPQVQLIPISMVDPNHKSSPQAQVMHYLMVKPLSQAKDADLQQEAQIANAVSNRTHHDEHLKSDARQSPFFGGLGSGNPFGGGLGNGNPFGGGLGNGSPFGGGFFRPPQLPSLPTIPNLTPFTPFGQQQSRPPKTSVIGNSGGAMALTNDNVVVVNVLSGNY